MLALGVGMGVAAKRAEPDRRVSLGSIARGLLSGFRLIFSVIGICATGVVLFGWYTGLGLKPEDIARLFPDDGPAMKRADVLWKEAKFVVQYGAYFIAAIAFAVAVAQIKTVDKLISDFLEARGPIYALGTTIGTVEKSVATLTAEIDRLSTLEPTIQRTAEKIEDALKQIGDLQRLAVSERTDDDAPPGELAAPAAGSSAIVPSVDAEAQNWERLRELWNANGARLDEIRESIADNRKRSKFVRMSRSNYPAIINALADDHLISEAARRASLNLHATFLSHRSRKRSVTDRVVADMEVLNRLLDHELPVEREQLLAL